MADRTVVYRLQASVGQFRAQMAQAGASVKKAADDMTSMDKSAIRSRQALDQLGGTAGKVGLVAAAGLGAAVVTAANFDQQMSNVAATGEEARASMGALRDAAIQAGADTAFSAGEAAAGIENLLKAGVSTADVLGGGLAGSLDLAAAGELEVADAAELAATAMTQFGLGGEQVNHVADLLAAGAGKAQGDVSDLGMALKQSGLVAAQTGLSIEETVGTLSAFASAGLLGSDAGTSFKTMLQSLTPSSVKAKEEMERLGISAYDAQGNFIGMTEFAANLREGLSDLSVEQQNAALKTIFGSDAVRAAAVIYDQGADGIQGWIDKTNDAGYAAETAGARLDNLKGDFEALMGSIETALIGTGDGAQGPLRSLTQGATDAVNAYNDLPAPIKSATAAAAGLTAVIGGGLWFGSKVIQGVADTRQALSDLGITAGATGSSLKRMGATSAVVFTLATAVGKLNEAWADANGDNIDGANLNRNLEALANGYSSDVLDTIVNDLRTLDSSFMSILEPVDEFTTAFGLFGRTEGDRAADNIEQVDQALAGLVESGNADQAAAAFEQIVEAFGDRKVATDALDAYETALRNAGEVTGLLTPLTRGLSTVTGKFAVDAGAAADGAEGMASAADRAEARIKRMNAAIHEARTEARGTASSFVGLAGAVEDGKQSLSDFLKNMEKQAAALRDFRENAAKAAKRGLSEGLIAELQRLGPEGARQMAQLANATDAELKRANRAWQAGQREANAYTRAVGGVPKSVSTDVKVNAGSALNIIDLVKQQMRYLDGLTSTTYVETVRRNRVSGGDQKYASGGEIHGPGTATSDSIPIYASDGEFMMKAAAVDFYGPQFMHDVNSMRFAEGGMVQRYAMPASSGPVVNVAGSTWSGSVALSGADVQRIADAVRVGAAAGVSGREQARDRVLRGQVRGSR